MQCMTDHLQALLYTIRIGEEVEHPSNSHLTFSSSTIKPSHGQLRRDQTRSQFAQAQSYMLTVGPVSLSHSSGYLLIAHVNSYPCVFHIQEQMQSFCEVDIP